VRGEDRGDGIDRVYWIAIYEILEARGFEVLLVNARDFHNVRGRKSDVSDCEWLQELHGVGLLRPSFRPAGEIVALRSYLRDRQTLVEEAAARIQRMHKALTQMNLQLHTVISDLTGTTGLNIVRSILAGERDPATLAAHRDYRCKAPKAELVAALTGNYRPEHLFSLRQNFEAYQFLLGQIPACDTEIAAQLAMLADRQPPPSTALPPARRQRTPGGHDPRFELRSPLHRLTGGADLSQIDAIGPYAALQPIAELGTAMSRWRSPKHFTSWLTLVRQQQGLRRTPAQLQNSALRGDRPAPLRDEPNPHPNRTRRLLPTPGVSSR